MIDWDRLTTLKADIGEEDFADVAMIFVAEISEHLTRLTNDPVNAAASDFHFLRGSAANLGFAGLAEACARAEAACKAGTPPDVTAVASSFTASISAVAPRMPEIANAA